MLSKALPERENSMNNRKIIAMMMTLSMLAAAFAGCLGDDDEEPEPVAVLGCMDATANNYNDAATEDDGSCTHDLNIKIGFLNDATGPIAVYAEAFTFAANAAGDALSMTDGYTFEIVEADSACDGTAAATAAQTLVDSGVVAVAGAACSGASIGANAVLTAAGIPMVSYASTSPALSDATAHPDFFRVVPSDALQGGAMADMVAASGVTSPALIHMTKA